MSTPALMRWLERLEEGLLSLLLAAMVTITFTQVVARYVFNYSFVWALELTGVLFACLMFIGFSYCVRVGAHIGIDILVRALGPRPARAVGILAASLCVAYSVTLAVGGWRYMHRLYEVGIYMQDLPFEQWIPKLVLPVGFGLLALRFLAILWRLIRGRDARLLGSESDDALKLRDAIGSSE